LGFAGLGYLVAAVVMGGGFLALGLYGLVRSEGPAWARRVFFSSIAYLPALFVALMLSPGGGLS
ncbi:MAG: heme o synthase, partial [Myxococcaceae bacterium]